MNILGFDTSLNKTYLALQVNKIIYSEIIESTSEKYHSAYLVKKIVELLKKHKLTPQNINLIATNIGPGSFTGIRVGLTVARAFAQGINIHTASINSLELISEAYSNNSITILDARRNKAYVGNSTKIELINLENLPEFCTNYEGEIIADSTISNLLKEQGISCINFEKDNIDYGKKLIELAQEKFVKGETTNWQGLKPLYIQPPPIHKKN